MNTKDEFRLNTEAEVAASDHRQNVHAEEQHFSLREAVEFSMEQYFEQLGDDPATGLYDLVLNEVEAPLLEAVLHHTGSNQSKASIILGLNRGTLRKKLKQHGLL